MRDRSRVHAPWIFRRQPAIPTPDLFTVQAVVPSDPASGNQALQHNLRLTLGSGLITAMLAVSSQIHASPLSSHPALTAPPPSSIEQGGIGNAPEVGRATAQVRDPMSFRVWEHCTFGAEDFSRATRLRAAFDH